MGAAAQAGKSNAWRAIFWGGAACGVLDMAFALVAYGVRRGVPLIRIPQSIARGLLGNAAFDGGVATAALGTVLHFVIAFSWAAIYVAASRRLHFLRERAALWGVVYGAVVFTFMYYVVMPLSRVGMPKMTLESFLIGIIGHMILVGPPIALAAKKW